MKTYTTIYEIVDEDGIQFCSCRTSEDASAVARALNTQAQLDNAAAEKRENDKARNK